VILNLVLVKLMHQAVLVEVVAILTKFSRCSSEFFDEILLFLCFILENICSEMYVLPLSEDIVED